MTDAPRVWLVALGIGFGCHGQLAAQGSPQPAPRWAVSAAIGAGYGWATRDVEAAMVAGGFDDCTFCSDPTFAGRYPVSFTDRRAWTLTVQRRVGRKTHVQFMVGRAALGETHGHNDGPPEAFVQLRQRAATYAIMASAETDSARRLWVSAGPALYRVALEPFSVLTGEPDRPSVSRSRFGAVMAGGLVFPLQTRYFIQLQGQYRLVGKVELGPIDVPDGNGGSAGMLPRTAVNFNHWLLLLGTGVHF